MGQGFESSRNRQLRGVYMFKVDGELIESISIGNNKYQLRTNGIFIYSKILKTWSPYARREID